MKILKILNGVWAALVLIVALFAVVTITQTSNAASCIPQASNGTIKPINICTSFKYSEWSACQLNGIQKRSVISSLPADCSGGAPSLIKGCTYTLNTSGAKPSRFFKSKAFNMSVFRCRYMNLCDTVELKAASLQK